MKSVGISFSVPNPAGEALAAGVVPAHLLLFLPRADNKEGRGLRPRPV